MKFKKFKKTKERMSTIDFADKIGHNRDNYGSTDVFVYLGAIAVEILETEEFGEKIYETYLAFGGNIESSDLEDVERALYESLVKDGTIKLKEKKEDIDPKMPLGLDSYLDSFYQISSFIGFQSDRYIRGKMVLKANNSVRKFTDELTSYEQGNEVKKMTTELEQRIYKLDNSDEDEEYCHLEEIDKFCSEKFPSEGMIKVIYSMSATEYEIASYMGTNRNTPLFESLDGADGQHTKAIELAKEFDLKFKDADWGRGDIGSFYEMIDEFLKETFYPKKTFKALARVTTYCTLEIEADSQDEANMIAKKTDGGDFISCDEKGDFDVIEVEEQ